MAGVSVTEEEDSAVPNMRGLRLKFPVPGCNMVRSVKGRSFLKPASPAQIMRAGQRDSSTLAFIEQEVAEQMRELIRNMPTKENVIQIVKHFATLLYYGCTTLAGLQTLGEEYSGILMVSGEGRIPSKVILLEMVLLKCCGGPLVSYLLRNGLSHALASKLIGRKLTPEDQNKMKDVDCLVQDVISCLPVLNSGIFYLAGDYYDIPKRIARIRYVLVHFWLKWKSSHSGFVILGIVSLLYAVVMMVQAVRKYKHQGAFDGNECSSTVVHCSNESRCPFCFEVRKHPAVTPCGHLFCWKCIMEAVQVDNKCPLCRERVEPSRVVILKNYDELKVY